MIISQPYLTQLIKRIEKKLGTKIINRDRVPFSLTEAGMIYYKYLENISYNDQQLERDLAPYTEPNKEIQLFENSPQKNETNLLNGDIDCYIGQTPETISHDLNYLVKNGEQYYVVIPQNSHYFRSDKFILEADEL